MAYSLRINQLILLRFPGLSKWGLFLRRLSNHSWIQFIMSVLWNILNFVKVIGPALGMLGLLVISFCSQVENVVVLEVVTDNFISLNWIVRDYPFCSLGVLSNVTSQLAFGLFLSLLLITLSCYLFSYRLFALYSIYLVRLIIVFCSNLWSNNFLLVDLGWIKSWRYLDSQAQFQLFNEQFPLFSYEQFLFNFYDDTKHIHNPAKLNLIWQDQWSQFEHSSWWEIMWNPVFFISVKTGFPPEAVTAGLVFLGGVLIWLSWKIVLGFDSGGDLPPVDMDIVEDQPLEVEAVVLAGEPAQIRPLNLTFFDYIVMGLFFYLFNVDFLHFIISIIFGI